MLVQLEDMAVPKTSICKRVTSFHGCIPEFLNTLFILHVEGKISKLAYITMLEWVGNPIPHGDKGMSYIESRPKSKGDIVVRI